MERGYGCVTLLATPLQDSIPGKGFGAGIFSIVSLNVIYFVISRSYHLSLSVCLPVVQLSNYYPHCRNMYEMEISYDFIFPFKGKFLAISFFLELSFCLEAHLIHESHF